MSKYERTFVVAVPVAKAWTAFTEPQEREAWMGKTPEGFEPVEVKVGAVEQDRKLSWSQNQPGLEGSYQTTVTFEDAGSGTRITIVRSGFGDSEAWQHYTQNTARGWDEIIADLVLYLETGVRGGRHYSFRSSIAATRLQSPQGVRITHVVPGGFAAQAGLRPGDLLLRLNGASIVSGTDVCVIEREHAPGTVVEVEFMRGNKTVSGKAALSPLNYGDQAYVGHPGGYPRHGRIAA